MAFAIDLFCGTGGWADGLMAAGLHVIGYDILPNPSFRGEFRRMPVQYILPSELVGAVVICASPPCTEFSRHDQPWTRKRNPPPPDMSLVRAAFRLGELSGVPLVLENVRGAQKFIGPAQARFESCYLWGDGVPALLPAWTRRRHKERFASNQVMLRARVPYALAYHIGQCYRP